MLGEGAFLEVERSLSGRPWRARPAQEALVRGHQAAGGHPEPIARALAARGVQPEAAEAFLRPTLKALFPDPSSFADMDRAACVILDALTGGRRALVFADYDVDGATSAALLVRWFRAMGAELPIYVPDRLAEGYGPSPAAFRRLREGGTELVITVDCGAAAHDAIATAEEIGLDLVVIDHHLMRGPPTAPGPVVNPNRPDCRSGQGILAAAGVTFVLLVALNREARRRGLFAARPEPDLRRWLDLAALGAVCDVTPLLGFNRALAVQGFRVMAGWANPGLAALRSAAALAPETRPGVFEAGFVLGPRINAGGRIGRSDMGARLLSTDDPLEAAALAAELDALNRERRSVEQEILRQAIQRIESESNFNPRSGPLVVAGEGWHPGVIGIVASRLRERYGVPAVVIGVDREADIGRGSGRSVPGANLGGVIVEALEAGLLLTGGGHAMAAGLSLRPSSVPELRAFLAENLRLSGEPEAVEIDALIGPGAAGRDLLEAFAALAPFGPGNPEPVFALAGVAIDRVRPMRGGHLRCELVGAAGERIRAVAWRAAETPLGRRLMAGGGAVHVAGRLKADEYEGRRRVELEIEDMADPRARAQAA